MPNYVSNRVEVIGKKLDLERLIDFVGSEESVFDFNKIIPMPDDLHVSSGSGEIQAMMYFMLRNGLDLSEMEKALPNSGFSVRSLEKGKGPLTVERFEAEYTTRGDKKAELSKLYDDGKRYYFNYKNYGFTSWYYWAKEKWGTKWNACDPEISELPTLLSTETKESYMYFHFNTAWDPPVPVFEALFGKFPELEFEITSTDEDPSIPVTVIHYKNGKSTCEQYERT